MADAGPACGKVCGEVVTAYMKIWNERSSAFPYPMGSGAAASPPFHRVTRIPFRLASRAAKNLCGAKALHIFHKFREISNP